MPRSRPMPLPRARTRIAMATTLALAGLGALAPAAQASSTALDPTFGNAKGLASVNAPGGAEQVAVDASDRILVLTYGATTENFNRVARLTANGGTDSTFAGGKSLALPAGTQYAQVVSLPDGSALIAGDIPSPSFQSGTTKLTKVTPAGVIDMTYGTSGTATVATAGRFYDVHVSGTRTWVSTFNGDTQKANLTALTQTGAVDTMVAAASAQPGVLDTGDSLPTFTVDGSGRVVVATSASTLRRYTSAGEPDTTFGTSGTVTTVLDGPVTAAVNAGKYLFADDFHGLVEITSDGKVDTSFGTNGLARLPFPGCDHSPSGIALTSAGIYISGYTPDCGASDLYVLRLTTTGALDRRFADVGIADYPQNAGSNDTSQGHGQMVQVQSSGKPVIAAWGRTTATSGLTAVIRMLTTDTAAPTVSTSSLGSFTLAANQVWSYKATDSGTGVANYDVRQRTAAYNGNFTAYNYPSSWQKRTTTSVSRSLPRGTTVCLSARARDKAGNVSGWSADRCTAAALDDSSLTAAPGWNRLKSSVYYAGTYSKVVRKGATLTRTGLQTRRIALVATKCKGCGSVGVYFNGTLLKQVSLASTTTSYRQVVSVATFVTARSGTLVIKTLSASPVFIDGIAVNRT